MIQGFDISWRFLVVIVPASIPGLGLMAILWPWLHFYAFVPSVAVVGGIYWAVESRTRGGLRVRKYRSWWDKRTEPTGKLVLCGQVIQVRNHLTQIRSASISVVHGDEQLFPVSVGRQVVTTGEAWY